MDMNEALELSSKDGYVSDNKMELVSYRKYEHLTHWIYNAILEATHLDNFRGDMGSLTELFGISKEQLRLYVARLIEAGLLDIGPDGRWKDMYENASTVPHEDLDVTYFQEYQISLKNRAEESILHDSGEEKSHTSIMSAVDADLIPEIKQDIKDFRKKILDKINKQSKKKDALYALQLSLMPLVERENEKPE